MIYLFHTSRSIQTIGYTLGTLFLGLTPFSLAGMPVGTEFQINESTQGSQHQPTLARNASGQTIVLWKQDGQHEHAPALVAQRYDTMGNPTGSESILHHADQNDMNRPAAAMAPNGMVLAVWEGQIEGGEGMDILSQRFGITNQPIGPVVRVNSTTAKQQRHAAVAIGQGGESIVLWESEGEGQGDTDIFGQRYDANGSPVGNEYRVNTTTAGNQKDPVATFDHQGNIFVVWQGESPSGNGAAVYGQRYDPQGNQLGSEFLVNTTQTLTRMRPAIATHDDGHVAVIWPTDDPETTQLRLVAQYYDLAGNPTVVPDLSEIPWHNTYGQVVRDLAWNSETPSLTTWASFDEASQWDIKGEWTLVNTQAN